jgi:WD40 repeat protein
MTYVPYDADGNEVMYVGTFCGQIHSFLLYRRKFPRNLRSDILSRDSQHSGSVTCILYSKNSELSTSSVGIVISGSSDRTIKIWSPTTTKPLCIQTLYGHEGTITQIADGHDGTLLSCSVDGTLRLWKPQRGRKIMLHHFLECTYVMRHKNSSWLSSLAVSPINIWACYVGNMDGTIEIYHKGADNNEAERKAASFTGQLTRFKCWEHIHTLGIHEIQIIYDESFLISLSSDHCCKILDLHLGTILHTIRNSHNCKYMGIIWDSNHFQMYLSDENGYLEIWSSFYERKIEDLCVVSWKPPKRETNSLVGGNTSMMNSVPLGQLVTMPLMSKISKLKSSADCIIALHPRRGYVTLWQVLFSSLSSSLPFSCVSCPSLFPLLTQCSR